jgi:tetratricopeptide (TPR) repeat protein
VSYRSALILASGSVAALVTGLAIWYSSGPNSRLNALAYSSRGNAYLAKGDLDRAIVDFTEAIRLDPKYAEAYYNRGTAYATKGDRESAVGDFFESNGDYPHAVADYDEAIRLKPNLAEAYYGRGHVLSQNFPKGDRWGQAAANFDEAIRLNPKIIPWSWPESPVDWNSLTIVLSRSMCFGPCPAYQVEIRGDGSVSYTGGVNVAIQGRQVSQIPRESVRALFRAFRRAAYLSLPDNASTVDVTDTSDSRTSIGYDGRVKSVEHNGTGPTALRELEDEIDNVAGTAKWIVHR